MASMTMSQALVGTVLNTSSAPRRATRSAPGSSKNLTMAVFRPGFRQQRPQPQQRCGPRQACGPGMAFGAGPMGFTVNGRPMSAEDMMREAERLWMGSGWDDAARSGAEANITRLAVDVIETDDAFTFTTDVPGVSRDDVKVQAKKEERELTISGSRAAPTEAKPRSEGEGSEAQQQQQQQAGRRRRIERRFGKFSRTFKLPDNADISGITARFDNGVLTVTVKKTQSTPVEVTDIPISI